MIYIAKFDVFGEGRLLYRVQRILKDSGLIVENGFDEIYVNVKVKDESRLSKLTQYMVDTRGGCAKFPKISKRVKYLREENGGLEEMCEIVERYAEKKTIENVKKLFHNGAFIAKTKH